MTTDLDNEWMNFMNQMDNKENPYSYNEDSFDIFNNSITNEDENELYDTENKTLIGNHKYKDNHTSDIKESTPTKKEDIPIPSNIYISTKTKIAYINCENIDLERLYWFIPIIQYYNPIEGVIKKQIKITSLSKEHEEKTMENFNQVKNSPEYKNIYHSCKVLKHIDMTESGKAYKHVVKFNFGLSNKDIISYRTKEKGVFYNCFAIVLRLYDELSKDYKEINIKIFNTGKLQIPGIKEEHLLFKALDALCVICEKYYTYIGEPRSVKYDKNNIHNELINSNFNCGFYINRHKLLKILKTKYNIIAMFDNCSYPGIQSKFYYNENKTIQDGKCECEKRCTKKCNRDNTDKCIEISFMTFRTGSVMIVGRCKNDEMLYEIYEFIKNILITHYDEINEGNIIQQEPIAKKPKKRVIYTTLT